MRTREDVEATGHKAICDVELGQMPGCEHHSHLPGEPLDESPRTAYVVLDDIPVERVQEALKALLDLDDLRGVISVEIGMGYVSAAVNARDSEGRYFRGPDGGIARHTLTRKVLR